MGILSVNVAKINLYDVNFDEDDPETITHGIIDLNIAKHLILMI